MMKLECAYPHCGVPDQIQAFLWIVAAGYVVLAIIVPVIAHIWVHPK